MEISLKNCLQILVTPTSTTIDDIALNVFPDTIQLLKKLTIWMIFELDQNWQNSEQSFE